MIQLQNPKFLFRLHMARSRYREAAKVAIILANNEQVKGKNNFYLKFKT